MKRRVRICVALITVNLAFIWGNSLLPGEISGMLSDWLASLLGGGQPPAGGTGLLRKLAHFSEFACLGFLLARLAHLKGERGHHLISLALLGGLLTACIDESIQLLTPDRGPSLVDVWIDTCGVATGVAALFVIHYMKNMISGGNNQ
ncbi:MAG: VanZ family protein [Oscillospiraceae bacterium]|nr:VanZ family protein [Oscillospiraceae bacterium]